MRFRRRKFINDAGLQIKFSLLFIAVSLAVSIASTVAFNVFALKRLDQLIWKTHIGIKDTGEIIGPLFIYINSIGFISVAVLLIITVIWMMKRTAGPIYRMAADIRKIAGGDLTTDISLRQKDAFGDTARELNIMAESMREKFEVLTDKYKGISSSVTVLKEKTGTGEVSVEDYNAILEDVRDMKTELRKFCFPKGQ